MSVESRIRELGPDLSPLETRVAELILTQPQLVGFGTVAALAETANTSGATVVRLANKLGYDGFVGLQADIRAELTQRLGPAATRIATAPQRGAGHRGGTVAQVLDCEIANLEATLRSVDSDAFARAVALLADMRRQVVVIPGDCARGVAQLLTDQLAALRDDVALADGNPLKVGRDLAGIGKATTVLLIDFARYDRIVLTAEKIAAERGAAVIALTDSVLGTLARHATVAFSISAVGVGPFDSQTATLALAQALVAAVADRTRAKAATRLQQMESAWQAMDAVVDID